MRPRMSRGSGKAKPLKVCLIGATGRMAPSNSSKNGLFDPTSKYWVVLIHPLSCPESINFLWQFNCIDMIATRSPVL